MVSQGPYVITISRQLGSGGAYLGRRVASELGIAFADRDILERAAQSLEVKVEDAEARDEAAPTFMEAVLESFAIGAPEATYLPPLNIPSYEALRAAETAVILEIASRRNAVIVGRAGFHLLAKHPRHLSVFLHASLQFRRHRVEQVYGLPAERALSAIEESDAARGRYLQALTGRAWTDTLQYDLSLCTSSLGLIEAGELVCAAAKARFHLP